MLKIHTFLGLLTAILFSPILSGISAYAETIKFRADHWYPFNGEPKSQMEGYVVDIAREIFSKQKIDIDYQLMPWARALKEVDGGSIDGIVCVSKSEAPTIVYPDESFGEISSVFFALPSLSWRYSGMESLAGKRIGYASDYSYGEEFQKYVDSHQTDKIHLQGIGGDDPMQINIEKLLKGRIDLVIATPEVLRATLSKMGKNADFLINVGGPEEKEPIYIGLNPKNPNSARYAKILSEGIIEMKRNGRWHAIQKRYGLSY